MADTSRVDIDVLDTALRLANPGDEGQWKNIARALQAERERCAKIVEQGLGRTNTSIVMSIRSGEPAR